MNGEFFAILGQLLLRLVTTTSGVFSLIGSGLMSGAGYFIFANPKLDDRYFYFAGFLVLVGFIILCIAAGLAYVRGRAEGRLKIMELDRQARTERRKENTGAEDKTIYRWKD